jgi:hypothetical protein
MWRSAFVISVTACIMSGAASAQDFYMPDPQKIGSMTKSCVYNNAFYSQGAIICLSVGRGLQCSGGSWIATQDPIVTACKDQMPIPVPR